MDRRGFLGALGALVVVSKLPKEKVKEEVYKFTPARNLVVPQFGDGYLVSRKIIEDDLYQAMADYLKRDTPYFR